VYRLVKSQKQRSNTNNISSSNIPSFLCNQGIQFEDIVVKRLEQKFPNKVYNVNSTYLNYTSEEKYKETINCMKKGIPIILQGSVKNYKNGTAGIPDIIVRSDYINRLTSNNSISRIDETISSNVSFDYHYRIIDIKFSTIPLKSDGISILNSGRYPSYKGQCFIYNEALGQMQGYTPSSSYILGRGWTYTCKGKMYEGKTPFTKLGTMNFLKDDSHITGEVNKSLEWLKLVDKEGESWTIEDRKDIYELYPNMSNQFDDGWRKEKLHISNEIFELTRMYFVGKRERDLCLDKGIDSWKECTAEDLGIKGDRGKIINKMIKLNRGDYDNSVWKLPIDGPKLDTSKFNIYIDFEVINDAFMEVGLIKSKPIIFFIGIGYEINNEWVFEKRMIHNTTDEEEKRICKEIYERIINVSNGRDYQLIHWSGAEPRQWFGIAEKYNIPKLNGKWFDLLKFFKDKEIVIKDTFGYGLKEICWALRKHGKIAAEWEDDCTSGVSAMIMLKDAIKETDINIEENEKTKHISKYNEIDCKVLMEIYKLF